MYTVKQLSTLAGVTPRTLHHYDQIDLLKPESIGENGYRYYGEDAALSGYQLGATAPDAKAVATPRRLRKSLPALPAGSASRRRYVSDASRSVA